MIIFTHTFGGLEKYDNMCLYITYDNQENILGVQRALAKINICPTDPKYWLDNGKRMVAERSKMKLRTNTAKNVIIFMGDGMSLTTLTAARIYKGQLEKNHGESDRLSFERFPYTGISKVRQ